MNEYRYHYSGMYGACLRIIVRNLSKPTMSSLGIVSRLLHQKLCQKLSTIEKTLDCSSAVLCLPKDKKLHPYRSIASAKEASEAANKLFCTCTTGREALKNTALENR